MAKKTYTVESTYETMDHLDNVTASLEVRYSYTWVPGCDARVRYDEHDHAAEGDEIEITAIEEEAGGRGNWTAIPPGHVYDTLHDWATMNLMDAMVEEARETEAANEDDAAECRAAERRDKERFDE